MDNCGGSQLHCKCSPMVELLNGIMARRGKLVKYTMLSAAGLIPSKVHTCSAICGDLETYGCGLTVDEAIENAANKFLEKLSSVAHVHASVQNDDHLVNSLNSLRLESKVNVISNNYVGTLQEYCQAYHLDMPKYEYYQDNDIKNKRRLYYVICSFGPHKFTGVGLSKQIAKKYAARLMYNQINSNYAATNNTSTSNSIKNKLIDFGEGLSRNEAKNNSMDLNLNQIYLGTKKVETFINYIGKLQEICIARGWGLPKYDFHRENINEISIIYYSVICSVESYKSKGIGNSKKVAKNKAAQLVYAQIDLDPQKISIIHSDFKQDKSYQLGMRNLRYVDPCEYIQQVKLLCNQLSLSKKECMQRLKRCYSLGYIDIDMSLFEFLKKLAHQEDLSITYERFSNNDNDTQVYGIIYIQSSTKYGMTNIGNGKTDAEAKNVSAKSILAFIKNTISMI